MMDEIELKENGENTLKQAKMIHFRPRGKAINFFRITVFLRA